MTNGGVNAIVPRNPTLRSTLRTLWNERWVFWVRLTGPIPEELLSRYGVEVVRSGLIPVAGGAQRVTSRIDREGPILEISSLQVVDPMQTQSNSRSKRSNRAVRSSGHGETGFQLMNEVVTHLGGVFDLSPYCLLPVSILTVGTAMGPAARLQTPVWPGLLNSALHVALCDVDGRLSQAVDFILQPLRDLQKARFTEESESTQRWIQERIKRLESYHEQWTRHLVNDPNSESRPGQIAALRTRLKPVMLIENPAPGEVVAAMAHCADASLLVTYDDTSLCRLLDKARTASTNDFRLLHRGWEGGTFQASGIQAACCPIVQPCISCLILCRPDTLGRLLSSEEPAVQQFCQQLVRLATCEESRKTPISPGQSVELFTRWQDLIAGLVGRRRSGADYRIELSNGAQDLAMKHWQEELRSQGRRLGLNVPALAGKFALCSRLTESHGDPGVSAAAMQYSIRIAKWCSEYGVGLTEVLTSKSQKSELLRAAEKMLMRIREHGRITPRDLYRTYDCQRKELHQPVLEHLIKTGQARYVGGYIEPLDAGSSNL